MNKAKAISAKLLELNLKNKLDEKGGKTGRNCKKQEETEKLKKKLGMSTMVLGSYLD